MANKKTIKQITALVDLAHEMLADGKSGHKVIEALLKQGHDMFVASHAVAQARKELEA